MQFGHKKSDWFANLNSTLIGSWTIYSLKFLQIAQNRTYEEVIWNNFKPKLQKLWCALIVFLIVFLLFSFIIFIQKSNYDSNFLSFDFTKNFCCSKFLSFYFYFFLQKSHIGHSSSTSRFKILIWAKYKCFKFLK